MATAREIRKEVDDILATQWKRRDGRQVPKPEDIRLDNDAVLIDGTVLYADLVDSTGLVDSHQDYFAAEVYKSYLLAACRVISDNEGEITAFDGDRVMAVYFGNNKNSAAARSALSINWAVRNIVNPAIKQQYPNQSFQVRQAIGIDTSPLYVARTGMRGKNDLVWVGRAANYAAKLCGLCDDEYPVFITEQVHSKLSTASKFGGSPSRSMWEKRIWTAMGIDVYRSNWTWEIS